jgi:hypothetical protein
MSQVVLLKLPTGSSVPPGYSYVRTTRSGDIYHKVIPTVTPSEMDELNALFGQFGVNVAVVPASTEDEFLNAFAGMSVGGNHKRNHKTVSKRSNRNTRSKRNKTASKKR